MSNTHSAASDAISEGDRLWQAAIGEGSAAMDEAQLMEFVGQTLGDVGAMLGGAMVVIGDKLGLYRAMAGAGPLTSAELADKTGTAERYVREWLSAQAARGYVVYDGDGRFTLPDEHAIPLTDETSPACVIGAFETALGSVYATDTIAERFRTGEGFSWGAQDQHVLGGCERFFRPGYQLSGQPVDPGARWIETEAHARAPGWPTSVAAMARRPCSWPRRYPGVGGHRIRRSQGSVEAARKRAADAGLAERVRFQVATATTFDGHLRPRLLLRLPARHGRSGRRLRPRRSTSRPTAR